MLSLKEITTNFTIFFLKCVLFYYMVLFIGILKSIILTIILNSIHSFLMKKIFGLEILDTSDLNFIDWEPEKQYNMNFSFLFEGKNKERIKELFIERVTKFFKRMRQKMVYKYFNYYWEETTTEEATKQIFFSDDKLNTNEEFVDYLQKLMCNPFHINEFQYKVFIGENDNNQTYLIFQFDHSMGDGYAILCLISKFMDDFDLNKIPKPKRKSFLEKLKTNLLVPFVSLYAIYNIYLTNSGRTPFKIYKEFSINKKGYISKAFPLNQLLKINKKLNVTFNDLILAIISVASKKYCKDKAYNNINKNLNVICTVNMRDPPREESDFILSTESSCSCMPLELVDDVTKGVQKIHKKTEFLLRNNHLYPKSIHFLNYLTNIFLPFLLSRLCIIQSAKNFDFVISNVPGPMQTFHVGGNKMLKFFGLPNPGPHSSFISNFSYLNDLQFLLMSNENVEMNPKEFGKYIENEVNALLNEYNLKTY